MLLCKKYIQNEQKRCEKQKHKTSQTCIEPKFELVPTHIPYRFIGKSLGHDLGLGSGFAWKQNATHQLHRNSIIIFSLMTVSSSSSARTLPRIFSICFATVCFFASNSNPTCICCISMLIFFMLRRILVLSP